MAGPHHPAATQPRPKLLRCLLITLLAVIFAVGLIILIVWLAVRPAPIDYTVESASIHNFNLTPSDALNATFHVSLLAHNRNRHVSLYYDSLELTVWYADQIVAFADAAPFYQPRRNETRLDLSAAAKAVPLMGSVAAKVKKDRTAGRAEVEVRVRARIRFKVGVVKTTHYTMRVYCSQVVVRLSSSPPPFDWVYCDVDI